MLLRRWRPILPHPRQHGQRQQALAPRCRGDALARSCAQQQREVLLLPPLLLVMVPQSLLLARTPLLRGWLCLRRSTPPWSRSMTESLRR
jgi:hypothetical protein